jgi:phosphatidylglycerol:prolipoprotein diacylglycerol transferase
MHPVLFHLGLILIPAYGAVTALGLVLALFLAQRTARVVGVDPGAVWNLCVVALFAALVASRLLLAALNWAVLRRHPIWLLTLAMVHHPLLAAFGALLAAVVAVLFGRRYRLPLWSTADALAPPLALGMAFEQWGALMAGSGYGTEAGKGLAARWTVTYADPLAARWSGAPLGVALYPVQAYAALAFLTLSIFLLFWLPYRRQSGDVAGFLLLGAGVAIFFTEFWRDAEGRGALLGGALDGPQAAAILLVLAGGLALLERKVPAVRQTPSAGETQAAVFPPSRQHETTTTGHGAPNEFGTESGNAPNGPGTKAESALNRLGTDGKAEFNGSKTKDEAANG